MSSESQAAQATQPSREQVNNVCSEIAFVPIHVSNKHLFNYTDNKRRWDAFLKDINTNVYNIPTDITEQSIEEAVKYTIHHHFKKSIPSSASKKSSTPHIKSGYLLFCDYIRPILMKETPGIQFKQLGPQFGARWKELTQEQKDEWNARSAAEKRRVLGEAKEQTVVVDADEIVVEEVEEAPAPVAKKAKTAKSTAPSTTTSSASSSEATVAQGEKKKKKSSTTTA
jgi:hypothetical protein